MPAGSDSVLNGQLRLLRALQQRHLLMPICRQTAIGALQAYPGGLHVGGGINLDNASMYLDSGASHVIVTSFVFREGRLDWERLDALVRPFDPLLRAACAS
jgi:phosphoribosylformimino-5-aminoimidazole carboxamide ribonucleotide (ProFAR) isomerase